MKLKPNRAALRLRRIPANTVVHTPTEAEAKELLAILHENGYKWSGSASLADETNWAACESATCYCIRNMRVTYQTLRYFKKNDSTILTLADFKRKYCEEEKPQPKFKVGDKVRVIEPNCWHSGQIGIVRKARTSSEQVLVVFRKNGVANFYSEECLEPYTEPETGSTVDTNSNESHDLSQNSPNCDKSQELDLVELLKGHEGEGFFSLAYGVVVLEEIRRGTQRGDSPDFLCIRATSFDSGTIIINPNGKLRNAGAVDLVPSRALYEQYPLDPYTAWMKWKEEQKKHWVSVTAWIDDIECESDTAIDTDKIYFRTPSDRDKCIEEIKAIIEKYSKK